MAMPFTHPLPVSVPLKVACNTPVDAKPLYQLSPYAALTRTALLAPPLRVALMRHYVHTHSRFF